MGKIMTQGKKYNFNSLLNEYKILIPQIQRDYVQGRKSLRLRENRSKFIKDLVEVVKNKDKSTTLNFIYGYMEARNSNACFVPIDGQQRLTTLLLLETYIVAKKDGNLDRIKENFIYETRFTTGRFLTKLFENIKNLVNEEKIDESIRNQNWYAPTWDNDLSIKSCIEVLREIQDAFIGVDFTEYNTDRITFMLLEIKDLGRPNELYIKMNARGKQLTDFENLKAELYGYIEKEDIKQSLEEKFVSSFKKNMDGEWLEFIWNLFNVPADAENYTDVFYKDLLHWVFSTRLMLQKGKIIDLIYPDNNENIAFYSLSKYLEKNVGIGECLKDFNALLDLLVWIKKDENKKFIKEYNFSYETVFGDLIGKTLSTYPSRTLLFALTKYAKENKTYDEEIFKYYRVIKNVINNTPIDNAERFYNACDNLENYNCDLRNLENIKYKGRFSERQIDEEKEKLNLINNDKNWLQAIVNAEKHNYFKGEIKFALKLATKNNNLSDFTKVWKDIEIIFPENRKDGWYNMLHRLLLCYGDYSKDVSNGIYTLYYNDNKHNNEDWRGFLREDANFKLFKDCLEDFKSSSYSDFENFANNKIENISQGQDEFIYCLIKYPGLFEVMKSYSRYWKDENGRILLLWSSKRTQYVEYKTYVIYLRLNDELKNKGYNEEEINKKLIYHWGEGNDEMKGKSKAWLEFNGKSVCFNGEEFMVDDVSQGQASLYDVFKLLKNGI